MGHLWHKRLNILAVTETLTKLPCEQYNQCAHIQMAIIWLMSIYIYTSHCTNYRISSVFCGENFCAKIFSWPEAATKIYHREKLCTFYIILCRENTQGISAFAAFTCTAPCGRRMRQQRWYAPRFLLFLTVSEAACTSSFAQGIAAASTLNESEPFGSILDALAAWVTILVIYHYVASWYLCYVFAV